MRPRPRLQGLFMTLGLAFSTAGCRTAPLEGGDGGARPVETNTSYSAHFLPAGAIRFGVFRRAPQAKLCAWMIFFIESRDPLQHLFSTPKGTTFERGAITQDRADCLTQDGLGDAWPAEGMGTLSYSKSELIGELVSPCVLSLHGSLEAEVEWNGRARPPTVAESVTFDVDELTVEGCGI